MLAKTTWFLTTPSNSSITLSPDGALTSLSDQDKPVEVTVALVLILWWHATFTLNLCELFTWTPFAPNPDSICVQPTS